MSSVTIRSGTVVVESNLAGLSDGEYFLAQPAGDARDAVVVDDAMVRRAFVAYWGGQPNDDGFRVMKRALTAALTQEQPSG